MVGERGSSSASGPSDASPESRSSVSSRAFTASLWNFAGNWGQQLASVVIFLYLVRTLGPADFGLMALAAAAIDVMTIFGRFGQVEALMQRRFVSPRVASTSFWLLTAVGTASLILFLAGASGLGHLLGDARVTSIVVILAPVPLIFNLTQVHEYFLRRQFRYKGLALRNVSATTVSGIAAVIAASCGYGFYALVLQKLVFTVVYAISLALSFRWRPSLTFSIPAAQRLVRNGFNVVIANIIPTLNLRIIDVFVGTYLGVTVLGFLRTAGRLYELLFQLIVNPILSVSMSSLTAARSDGALLRSTYLLYLRVILILSAPVFGMVALLGRDTIAIAAGQNWSGAAMPFQFFCLTTIATAIIYTFLPLMLSVDRTRTIRDQAVLQLAVTAVTTFFAAQISLVAVLVVHLVRSYIFAAINIWLMQQHTSISIRDMTRELVPPLGITTVACGATAGFAHVLDRWPLPLFGAFALTGAFGGAVFLLLLFSGERLHLWRNYSGPMLGIATKALRRA